MRSTKIIHRIPRVARRGTSPRARPTQTTSTCTVTSGSCSRRSSAGFRNIARKRFDRSGDQESFQTSLLLPLSSKSESSMLSTSIPTIVVHSRLFRHVIVGSTGHVRKDAATRIQHSSRRNSSRAEISCAARQGGSIDALAPRKEGSFRLDRGAEGDSEQDVYAADCEEEEC